MTIKKRIYDFILKRLEMKDFDETIKLMKESHENATGKKLNKKELDELIQRAKISIYFSKKIAEIIAFVYNEYGVPEAMGVMTSVLNEYVHNAIKPESKDAFFKYLKGSIDGASAKQLKEVLMNNNEEEEKIKQNKMRYIG